MDEEEGEEDTGCGDSGGVRYLTVDGDGRVLGGA